MTKRIKPLVPFKGTAEEWEKREAEEKKIRQQLFNKFAKEIYPDKKIDELTFREQQMVYMHVEDQRVNDLSRIRLTDTCSGEHEGTPDKNICINCAHCYDLKEIGYYLDDVACELYISPYPYIERNTEACEFFERRRNG